MRVRIRSADVDAIIAHARAWLPFEACGLIAGRRDGDTYAVGKVYLLENADKSREHFTIAPQEQLAAVKDMRAEGLTPLGNFHSHPETPARPSEEDIRLARDPRAVYLILSLAVETPTLKAFHIEGGDVSAVELEVLEEDERHRE